MVNVVDDARSVPDLRRYFGVGVPAGHQPPFTGGRFERLGGGGDQRAVRDVINAADLIAVQMLSVQVPARAALELLEGGLARAISEQLGQLPTHVELGQDQAVGYISEGGPADTAWRLLKGCEGIGWVTAGKLLARKHPRLVPVYDEVVRCAVRSPRGFWIWLHEQLRANGGLPADRLAKLRADADLDTTVSLPRILDVVVWMRHHNSHLPRRCAGLGG